MTRLLPIPLTLLCWLTAALPAQGGTGQTQPPTAPYPRLPPVIPDAQAPQQSWWQDQPYMGYYGSSSWVGIGGSSPYQRAPLRGGFQGLGTGYTGYQPGFPLYTRSTTGFGAYPTGPDGGETGPMRTPLPRLREPGDPDWPSWIDIAAERRGLPPISPLRAVLVQSSDRVWYRERGEAAYVPLAFHDRFRIIEPAASALVRDQGEFILLLHDAATLRSLGPCELDIVDLTPELAEVSLSRVSLAWVVARARKLRVRMPDGSELDASVGAYRVQQVENRIEIENRGRTPLQWRGHGLELELPPVHALRLFVEPPSRERVPAALVTSGDIEVRREGRALIARGGSNGGSVSWAGVRVQLAAGEEARFDPLAGTTFPDGAASGDSERASKQRP